MEKKEGEDYNNTTTIRILCSKLILTRNEPALQWLIGSPFLPPFTIASTFKSIHTSQSPSCPDLAKESDDIRTLLLKGFDVIGALVIVENSSSDFRKFGIEAVNAARKLREVIFSGEKLEKGDVIGAVADLSGDGGVSFFVERSGNGRRIEEVTSVVYEEDPVNFVWERGCLLRCNVSIKMPVYVSVKNQAGERQSTIFVPVYQLVNAFEFYDVYVCIIIFALS